MRRPKPLKRLARVLAALLLGMPAGRAMAEDAAPPAGADYGFRLAAPGSAALFLEIPPCSDEEAWAIAREKGTQDGYRAYMQAFPDGCHFSEAAARAAVAVRPAPPAQVRRNTTARRQEVRQASAPPARTEKRPAIKKKPPTKAPAASRRHY